jgi:hypothetical protein
VLDRDRRYLDIWTDLQVVSAPEYEMVVSGIPPLWLWMWTLPEAERFHEFYLKSIFKVTFTIDPRPIIANMLSPEKDGPKKHNLDFLKMLL